MPLQAMWKVAKWYCQQGLMAGTVFREVLIDLQREGLSEDAQLIEGMLWERSLLHRLVGQSHCRHSCFGVVAGTAIREPHF